MLRTALNMYYNGKAKLSSIFIYKHFWSTFRKTCLPLDVTSSYSTNCILKFPIIYVLRAKFTILRIFDFVLMILFSKKNLLFKKLTCYSLLFSRHLSILSGVSHTASHLTNEFNSILAFILHQFLLKRFMFLNFSALKSLNSFT